MNHTVHSLLLKQLLLLLFLTYFNGSINIVCTSSLHLLGLSTGTVNEL